MYRLKINKLNSICFVLNMSEKQLANTCIKTLGDSLEPIGQFFQAETNVRKFLLLILESR